MVGSVQLSVEISEQSDTHESLMELIELWNFIDHSIERVLDKDFTGEIKQWNDKHPNNRLMEKLRRITNQTRRWIDGAEFLVTITLQLEQSSR